VDAFVLYFLVFDADVGLQSNLYAEDKNFIFQQDKFILPFILRYCHKLHCRTNGLYLHLRGNFINDRYVRNYIHSFCM